MNHSDKIEYFILTGCILAIVLFVLYIVVYIVLGGISAAESVKETMRLIKM